MTSQWVVSVAARAAWALALIGVATSLTGGGIVGWSDAHGRRGTRLMVGGVLLGLFGTALSFTTPLLFGGG